MSESLDNNNNGIIDEAVEQFINAQLQGQKLNIDEYVKKYPGYEHQIRKKIKKIQRLDGLFDCLMQADDSDYNEPIVEHDLIGKKLGDFEIVSLIGAGGMGAVFLARQVSLDRQVALKVISDISGARKTTLERFKREAKVLAKISHPNIVQVFDVGEYGQYSYFAMEYVKGVSLDKILADVRNASHKERASNVFKKCLAGQINIYNENAVNSENSNGAEIDTEYIVTISKIIISIATALEYAHNKGILHRDIKPSNIIIASDGTAKLVDFGLAKAESQQTVTMTGEFFGTPSYVSPEQIRKPDTVDCRSDVYSLAATYYECLTLHTPFEGNTVNETLTQVISKEVIPPKKRCPRLSIDFNTVLLHALEKAPEDRYQTALDFSADIQNVLNFKPITAKRPSITRRAYKSLRRSPMKVVIGCALIVTVILGYFLCSNFIEKRNKRIADERFIIGRQKANAGDTEGALLYYEKSAKANPYNAETHFRIGACFYLLKEYEKATIAYKEAIKIDPNFVSAYHGLGNAYDELGQDKEAIESYQNAIKINPNDFDSRKRLGSAYQYSGQKEKAIETFETIVKMNPNYQFAGTQNALGFAYFELNRYKEAITHLNNSIEAAPDYFDSWWWLALSYDKLGDQKNAIKAFEQVVRIQPENIHALSLLGMSYCMSNQYEKCIETYEKYILINSNSASAYYWLGVSLNKLERNTEALNAFKKSVIIDPNFINSHINLGIIYSQLNLNEDAILAYSRAVGIDSNDAFLFNSLGILYGKTGREQEAVKAFQEAIRIEPNNVDAYSNLGFTYFKVGQYLEAIKIYMQAINLGLNTPTLYNDLADTYFESGRYEDAIELLEKAIKIEPNNVEAYNILGISYGMLGHHNKLIEYLYQACKLTDFKDYTYIADLARAYAELGDFDKAVEYQNKANEITNDETIKAEYQKRLDTYKAKKPWRE